MTTPLLSPSPLKALIHRPVLSSRQARTAYIHPHLSNLYSYPLPFASQTGPIWSRYDVWSLPLIMTLVHLGKGCKVMRIIRQPKHSSK